MVGFLQKFIFAIFSFTITAIVFLNTYEVIANQNIPLANSLREMKSQDVINKVINEFAVKLDSRNTKVNNQIDEFEYLEIPSLHVRVYLEESRNIRGKWHQRPSFGHYISLNKDDFGNSVDYLIYSNKSWRTFPQPENIYEDTEIKFYTKKGFSLPFFVDEKMDNPINKSFIVNKSEKRQILLLIENTNTQTYTGYSLTMRR